MRRKPRAQGAGLEFAPPAKKVKIANHGSQLSSRVLDDTSYQRHLSALEKEWGKATKNRVAVKMLMAEMAPNRREWILKERPAVHEVLEMYPALKDFELVSNACMGIALLYVSPLRTGSLEVYKMLHRMPLHSG